MRKDIAEDMTKEKTGVKSLLFYSGFSMLLAHELDAMTQAEWRLLFVLRSLPEPLARDLFVILHVPVVAALLWLFQHSSSVVQQRSQLALSTFLIIHAGLHWHLRHHPLNTFESSLSVGLIYGAGLLGLLNSIAAIKMSEHKTPAHL